MAKIVIGYNNKIIVPGYFYVFGMKAKEAGQGGQQPRMW